ncbi:MAG: STAS domain-containing protein [Clostridia bacterium]|nr:STAS domain-containing protein [Clostridia bacterium]
MTIAKTQNGTDAVLSLAGRPDTTTAPMLEAEIGTLDGTVSLTLDFSELEYISSAGLRVILAVQKKMMGKSGELVIQNVNPEVNEVFEITGFSDILTIR